MNITTMKEDLTTLFENAGALIRSSFVTNFVKIVMLLSTRDNKKTFSLHDFWT